MSTGQLAASNRPLLSLAHRVLTLALAVNIAIFGVVLVLFFGLSGRNNQVNAVLIGEARSLFGDLPVEEALSSIPHTLPLHALWVVSADGRITSSIPLEQGHLADYLQDSSHKYSASLEEEIRMAMETVLEPLVDRYPLIGRTLTFHILTFAKEDGQIIGAAIWRPFAERLYWLLYAILIYLYLTYWALIPVWVLVDTRSRGLSSGAWVGFAALANILGVIIYLYYRRGVPRQT